MSEELRLLRLFDRFDKEQREAVSDYFERLREAYPHKSATEMWLTAIAAVRDGRCPWLDE